MVRYVAEIAAVPSPTPVTRPVAVTVAIVASDVAHVAVDVTSFVDPSEYVATAVNCDDAPFTGAVPLTTIACSVGDGLVELEHATSATTEATATVRSVSCRIMDCGPQINSSTAHRSQAWPFSAMRVPATRCVGPPREVGRSTALEAAVSRESNGVSSREVREPVVDSGGRLTGRSRPRSC